MTVAELKEVLAYDKLTGVFTWRKATAQRVKTGAVAGSVHPSGHIYISIYRKLYAAHRLAWLYMYGQWPTQNIDHIDGNPANNRIHNLRELSHTKNLQAARKARKNSRAGLLGVSYRKDCNKWQARIQKDKRSMSLGLFATAEEAHAAYMAHKTKS